MIDLEEIDLYATAPDATTSVRKIRAGKKYAAKILANARSIPNWKHTLAVCGKRWPARRITLPDHPTDYHGDRGHGDLRHDGGADHLGPRCPATLGGDDSEAAETATG